MREGKRELLSSHIVYVYLVPARRIRPRPSGRTCNKYNRASEITRLTSLRTLFCYESRSSPLAGLYIGFYRVFGISGRGDENGKSFGSFNCLKELYSGPKMKLVVI